MKREIVEIELVTPCFLGGAMGTAEWRMASIRGELRWWFRAVAGASLGLETVRAYEETIFGSTRQSAALRIKSTDRIEPETRLWPEHKLKAAELAKLWGDPSAEQRLRLGAGKEIESDPIQYLGFGPFTKGRLTRPYLPAGARARFELLWIRPVEEPIRSIFSQACWAWLYLGGIGARSRKGFGSLAVIEDEVETRKDLQEAITRILPAGAGPAEPLPEWTAFSPQSRIFLGTAEHRRWEEAMIHLGAWLIGFRRRYGYPRDERNRGGLDLKNRDYEWAAPQGQHLREGIPDRAGFGLPLPFKRKDRQTNRDYGENVGWAAPDGDARRASPLLLHVAKLGLRYLPVLTYLPARFLPKGGKLHFEKPPRTTFDPTPEQGDVVKHFLEDLAGKHLIQEVRL
jgi:hypothetical protein